MVDGSLSLLSEELQSFVLMSRLLGGYVGDDQEWLTTVEAVHPVAGALPQPIFRLAAAVKTSHELYIHESVPAWASKQLGQVVDCLKNPNSHWVLRADRRCIKSDGLAFALFGTTGLVTDDAAEKEKLKEYLKKLNKELKDCTTEAGKDEAKKRVSESTKKARAYRGTAVTLEGLARHVAHFL